MDYATQRRKMVENQLRANKVTDEALLAAFSDMPRERFVPKALAGIAYVDEDLEIAPGRFLTEPMILARLIQAAGVKRDDMVLDVAPATGYSTAILARLAGTVVAVEEDKVLAASANRVLNEEGLDTAVVVEGQHREGYAKQAPYAVILINGAVEELPRALLDQLAEGGRLVAVMKEAGQGRAVVMQKIAGTVSTRVLFDAATPLLAGFARQAAFVF